MLRLSGFIIFWLLLLGCDEAGNFLGKDKKKITYSYSCLDSTVSGKPVSRKIDKASGILRDLAFSTEPITDSMQTAYGKEFHQEMIESGDFKLVKNFTIQQKLTTALKALLALRDKPSQIEYSIYILQDTIVNAFTFGGHIYITQGMLKKCLQSDALLYAIIGHEIGHSERGHIKNTIKEMELADNIFGNENGSKFFELKKMLTASFNQKNELEADYYGIDLTNKLGYDVCTTVDFWKEMASSENKYSDLEDFFRTHPFSNLRAQCLSDHILTNFGKRCGFNKNAILSQDNLSGKKQF
jgi:predicted Zn-dependent protease